MNSLAAFAILLVLAPISVQAQTAGGHNEREQAVAEEMKKLAAYEVDLVLRSDLAGMERFYPDDIVVTNPFNQIIDKRKILERVKSNIIKYTSMTKEIEYFRLLGDMVITMGLETAKVTPDADRPDAGKMTYRRFTEIWMFRDGAWKKIVRHANHFDPNP